MTIFALLSLVSAVLSWLLTLVPAGTGALTAISVLLRIISAFLMVARQGNGTASMTIARTAELDAMLAGLPSPPYTTEAIAGWAMGLPGSDAGKSIAE